MDPVTLAGIYLGAGAVGTLMGGGPAVGPTLSSPGTYTPYSTGTGLQPGTPIPGIPDYTSPGYREQTWTANQPKWSNIGKPTAAWWSNNTPTMQQTGQGVTQAREIASSVGAPTISGPNYTGNAYSSLRATTPLITRDLSLDPYYEAAKQRAIKEVNRDAAARGTWGASTTQDQVANVLASMNAQQAMDEALYGLQATAEKREWEQMAQNSAASADESQINRALAEASRAGTLGDLWLRSDEADRQRILDWLDATTKMESTVAGGMTAAEGSAGAAQDEAYRRAMDYLNGILAVANPLSTMAGDTYSSMVANDQDLMNAITALALGQDAAAVAAASGSGAKSVAEAQGVMQLISQMQALGLTDEQIQKATGRTI